jgi:hypothetical protein
MTTKHDLDAEYRVLCAEHNELELEHALMEENPRDIEGHRVHRRRLSIAAVSTEYRVRLNAQELLNDWAPQIVRDT